MILLLLGIVSLILGSIHEKQFVVSSYTKDGVSDVKLMNFPKRGVPRLYSELYEGNNPSYFTAGDKKALYFVNEVSSFKGRDGGGITYVRVSKKGLEPVIGSEVNQGGGGPCFITMSHDRKFLLTANYGSGSVSVVSLNAAGLPGKVTETLFFQHHDSLESHPHMILFNPVKGVYYITDLGLDRLFIFTLDSETGQLKPADIPYIDIPKESGPRHMVMNRRCTVLYIADELNSTISVINISGDRPVAEKTISALPDGFTGENASADICLSHSGKFLYITNRGNNSIGVFRVQPGGKLTLTGHVSCGGNWPRNMTIDKSGRHMIICNQRSGDLAFFRINRRTGIPKKEDYSYKLNAPSCVKFIE